MNNGKYVFAQLVDSLPKRVFDTIVANYAGNRYVKHFTCWNQLLCMIFGQLTSRESLRDLITVFVAHSNKSYHLGFGRSVTRSNLSKANEKRNYKIFEEYAYHLIHLARQKLINDDFEIKGKIYAFDSTTIDLCLSVFWWAQFRKTKGGIKLHTLYDITTHIPSFVHITEASVHDSNAMDYLIYEHAAYYIFDRGYLDFDRLYRITESEAYFVIRAKSNLKFKRMYSNKVDKGTGLRYGQIGKLIGYYTSVDYPDKLRKVKFYDKENDKELIFLTNNFDLQALEIALLYKERWQVELFFKWVKQNLKIKSFIGTSKNAVMTQIWIALCVYLLLAFIKFQSNLKKTMQQILRLLQLNLFDKRELMALLRGDPPREERTTIDQMALL